MAWHAAEDLRLVGKFAAGISAHLRLEQAPLMRKLGVSEQVDALH